VCRAAAAVRPLVNEGRRRDFSGDPRPARSIMIRDHATSPAMTPRPLKAIDNSKESASTRSPAISPIVEIVAELKAGRMVILVDEEDRENEGDLVVAADAVTPQIVNFMARFGRGLICMPITEERANQLKLAPMTPV